HLEDALQRALAYASAGANGFFAPGLSDPDLIARLCELAPVPVNIMVTDHTPPSNQLAQLGVARISYGPRPYRQMIEALKAAGRMALLLG
ncbi:MAG TPA: isocitrate lyase/phosphoenolpyruvate mutase family protein, partial [Chloroflexia bacterium]|nr:isocitrate lyase/phosphoenolpyruvate mutase family protein [Chloroflexia bacterium]